MKRNILISIALLLGTAALAGQITRTGSTSGGSFSVTNSVSNVQYAPVAALITFAAPATGTVKVERVSASNTFELSRHTFTNERSLIWLPDFKCGFAHQEVLRVSFPPSNGAVQVISENLQ